MCSEVGECEHCLMAAQRREAPCRDAVDLVPSIVGQIRQGVRVYALRQPSHSRGVYTAKRDAFAIDSGRTLP